MPGNCKLNKKTMSQMAEHMCKHPTIHFSKAEIMMLLMMYKEYTNYTRGKGDRVTKMDRLIFRDFLQSKFGMTDDVFMDKIFKTFDKDNDSFISAEEWLIGLSVFLRGTLEEKIDYCFCVFCSRPEETHIKRDEMFQMLKNCLQKTNIDEDPDEGPKELVELVLKMMDLDRDTHLSLDDFRQSVHNNTLLLEVFGPCLPTPQQAEEFCTCLCADDH